MDLGLDSRTILTEDLIFRDETGNNPSNVKNDLFSATPIMAGRMINDSSPETPFMTSNFKPKPDTTPLVGKIEIEPIEESKIELGAIIIKKPDFSKVPDKEAGSRFTFGVCDMPNFKNLMLQNRTHLKDN